MQPQYSEKLISQKLNTTIENVCLENNQSNENGGIIATHDTGNLDLKCVDQKVNGVSSNFSSMTS